MSKNDGKRGTFEEDLQKWISRDRRITRGFSSEMLGGPGADFLRREIFRLAKMISRDRCSTSYDLASLFRGRRGTLDRWSEKFAKRIGTRPSALHAILHS